MRSLSPPSAAVLRLGVDFGYVRISSSGAMPVVSNSLFVARSIYPVVLEHEPNDDDAHAQKVVPPCDITGTFAPRGDNDLFRFEGRKGEIWWSRRWPSGSGQWPTLFFLIQKVGAKGQQPQDLASGDDLPDAGAGPDSTRKRSMPVRRQVPENGLYQVLISDLYSSQRGHPRLTYRLVIRREQPDFSVVLLPNSPVGADAVTIRAGGRTSAYVAAIRRDGFAGPIRVEAARCRRVSRDSGDDRSNPGDRADRLRAAPDATDHGGNSIRCGPQPVWRPQRRPSIPGWRLAAGTEP